MTFDNIIGLKNNSISGKMYELIGQGRKRNDSRYASRNPLAGEQMRDNMNRKRGDRKRAVWRIKEERGALIATKMEAIIDPILARFGRER